MLLSDAYAVSEQHIGSAIYRPFLLFLLCVCCSDSLLLFLGASIVCVNNLKRAADLVL